MVHIEKTGAGCSGRAARFFYMDQSLVVESVNTYVKKFRQPRLGLGGGGAGDYLRVTYHTAC